MEKNSFQGRIISRKNPVLPGLRILNSAYGARQIIHDPSNKVLSSYTTTGFCVK
jgi:hypothetical protein